jgi:hypothetical protein
MPRSRSTAIQPERPRHRAPPGTEQVSPQPRNLFCLFYQVEITYRHLPQKRTARPIVSSDCRGSTMRLWQPHGCFVLSWRR